MAVDRTILLNNKKVNDIITIDDLSENDVMKIMNIYYINGFPVRDEETGKWILIDEELDDFDDTDYNFNMFDDDEIYN